MGPNDATPRAWDLILQQVGLKRTVSRSCTRGTLASGWTRTKSVTGEKERRVEIEGGYQKRFRQTSRAGSVTRAPRVPCRRHRNIRHPQVE